jgi:glycosyltransferase involved in cell wall biosynthesis
VPRHARRAMKVVYVGPLPPSSGGIAQYGVRLHDALVSSGHSVAMRSWSSQFPRFLYKGVDAVDVVPPDGDVVANLRWWDPVSWWRAGRTAREADLLVFPWVTPFQGPAYSSMIRAAGDTPTIAIVHNPLPHEPGRLDETLARFTLSQVRGALVHSADAAEQTQRLVPDVPTVCVDLPPLLDVKRSPLPGDGDHVRLLFLGNVRPYKGIDVALDAMELLRDRPEVTLTIAGHVWGDEGALFEEIDRRGLAGTVEFKPGYVPDDEVDGLLAEHHLVVLPYREATQSGVAPLARAAGRGLIATDVGGLSESLRDGVDAVVVPPGDPAALAQGILDASARVAEMSAAAADVAATWSDVVDAILGLAASTGDSANEARRPGS